VKAGVSQRTSGNSVILDIEIPRSESDKLVQFLNSKPEITFVEEGQSR
jgi:hypothetical protein